MATPPSPNPANPDPFAITKPQAILAATLLAALIASAVYAANSVPRDWYTPTPRNNAGLPPQATDATVLQPDPTASPGLPRPIGNASMQRTNREPLGLVPFPTASNPERFILQRDGTTFHTATWLVPSTDTPAALQHYSRQLLTLGLTTRGIQLPPSELSPDLPPPAFFAHAKPHQPGRLVIRFLPADPPNAQLRVIYDQGPQTATSR